MNKAQQNLGNAIRIARERAGWSQERLSQALGSSQGTVSRLERGLEVKSSFLQKALELLSPYMADHLNIYVPTIKSPAPTFKTEKFKNWEISTFSKAAGLNSGDFTITLDLKRQKQAFIIGDAAGKGNDAAIVAATIQAAFIASIKTLNPDHLTVNGVRLAIESAYRYTIPNWKAGPSVILGVVDNTNNFVDFLNLGMPTVIGTNKGKLEYHKQGRELDMLGSKENPRELVPKRVPLSPGDSIFLFSDGFIEAFESMSEKPQRNFVSRYLEASSLLNNDSDAILKNLVEGGSQNRPIYENGKDDMSAMIILNRRGENG